MVCYWYFRCMIMFLHVFNRCYKRYITSRAEEHLWWLQSCSPTAPVILILDWRLIRVMYPDITKQYPAATMINSIVNFLSIALSCLNNSGDFVDAIFFINLLRNNFLYWSECKSFIIYIYHTLTKYSKTILWIYIWNMCAVWEAGVNDDFDVMKTMISNGSIIYMFWEVFFLPIIGTIKRLFVGMSKSAAHQHGCDNLMIRTLGREMR